MNTPTTDIGGSTPLVHSGPLCVEAAVAGRAHGKVILLGEHAVVYGAPALAGALTGGVTVEQAAGTGRVRIPAWAVEIDLAAHGNDLTNDMTIARALRAIVQHLGIRSLRRDVDLIVHFGLPTGSGLGSSAALAVAIARALGNVHGVTLSDEAVEGAAMASETVIHGRPSGLDHTVSQRGGFGLFVRERGLTPVHAPRAVPLVIGHTGKERDTKNRVARVAEMLGESPAKVRPLIDRIGELSLTGARAVERGDLATLAAAMEENQIMLRQLEVSCPEIEAMVDLARGAGALACKLTGGGGGGCVIALAPGRERNVAAAWAGAGLRSFVTEVGAAANQREGQSS